MCATFTLGLGIAIWIETLETRKHLSVLWGKEPPLIQSLLQQKVSVSPRLRVSTRWAKRRLVHVGRLSGILRSRSPFLVAVCSQIADKV